MEKIIYIARYLIKKILCLSIRAYQMFISPCLGPRCRFYPSCSEYALLAIQHHGSIRGTWLSFCRLCRCHPWSLGGYDPVLPNNKENM